MQSITFNPVTISRLNYNETNTTKEEANPIEQRDYQMTGADILASQNSLMLNKTEDTILNDSIPEYNKDIVADEADGHFSYSLRNNPEGFYLKNGAKINNFLRKGELESIPEQEEDVPDMFKELVEEDINEKKDFNRAIVDSVEILDSMMESKTTEPMIVYRYAPTKWLDTAIDEKVKDAGFFSTVNDKDSIPREYNDSEDKTCFEVWIPEGTPYLDLTDKGDHEMLFPRGKEFKILDDKSLEMVEE